jgi:DNA-binding response OmpR family regulator
MTGSLSCPKIIAFGSAEQLEPSFLAGASDYLKAPWDCRELIIRSCSGWKTLSLMTGDHRLRCSQDYLSVDGGIIEFSQFQTSVIHLLMTRPNEVVTYKEIRDCMGMSSPDYIKSLHVHMNRIRRGLKSQLPDIYGYAFLIENIRSRGYRFKISCE